jgi:hypothetical protein
MTFFNFKWFYIAGRCQLDLTSPNILTKPNLR